MSKDILLDILRNMLAAPGSTHRLKHGLALAFEIREADKFNCLTLSRWNKQPGSGEIDTVLSTLSGLGVNTDHVQRESGSKPDSRIKDGLHFLVRLSWPPAEQLGLFDDLDTHGTQPEGGDET